MSAPRRSRSSGGHRQITGQGALSKSGPLPILDPAPPSLDPPRDVPITDPRIEGYLGGLFASTDPVLLEMERLAAEEDFPIVGPVVGRLLRQIALTVGARDVFEMGSGFGYSTYFLAQAVGEGGRVVHTDFSGEQSARARGLLGQAGLLDRVAFEVGDALQILVNYPGPFDLIFIDVDMDRESYPEALDLARARVRPGGYIVADNVLWRGRVVEPAAGDAATQGALRYTAAALSAPDLLTTILPLRDGVALHLKLAEGRRRR